jgi:hypothetical protein
MSCSRIKPDNDGQDLRDAIDLFSNTGTNTDTLSHILRKSEIPESLAGAILESIAESPDFILELLMCMEGDPYLYKLIDKQHSIA